MDFVRTVRNVEFFLGFFLPSAERHNFLGAYFLACVRFFWVLSTARYKFLGAYFLACVRCVRCVRCDFSCLPSSPNLEYFEKFGNFPFPPCVLCFLKVHCHPNFPIIPSDSCQTKHGIWTLQKSECRSFKRRLEPGCEVAGARPTETEGHSPTPHKESSAGVLNGNGRD